MAQTLTENHQHDADEVESLLDQVPLDVETFYGDGAYDQRKVYDLLAECRIDMIVPPRKNAKIWQHGNTSADPLPRDECVRQIRRDGRRAWKESIGYHRRSLAAGGQAPHANLLRRPPQKPPANQQTEAALRCKLLNLFVTIGMPAFVWS